MDGNGVLSSADTTAFILALTNLSQYETLYPAVDALVVGDVNQDGAFDSGDIHLFSQWISAAGASTSTVPEPGCLTFLVMAAMFALAARTRGLS